MESDLTGRIDVSSNMRKMWNGNWCHKDEYEIRNPQDFLQARPERDAVDNVRVRKVGVYTDVTADDL
jgi:hypothetical protein